MKSIGWHHANLTQTLVHLYMNMNEITEEMCTEVICTIVQ